MKISVANDFSKTPGPAFVSEGGHAGETFRNNVLRPHLRQAMEQDGHLVVDLDGTAGYGAGFLEEAFGGLVLEAGGIPRMKSGEAVLEITSAENPELIDICEAAMYEALETRYPTKPQTTGITDESV